MPTRKFGQRFGLITIIISGLVAGACSPTADDIPPDNIQAEAPVAEPTGTRPLPAPPTLSRGDLVAAAAGAASAYAEGRKVAGDDQLVGRTFSIRLPFACGAPLGPVAGAQDAPGLAQWRVGDGGKTIALTLTPADWTEAAWLGGAGDGRWEAVEGYWIPRPWLAAETCPKVTGDPLATALPAPSPQTLGLAALHEAGSSRVGRRDGRAYTFTVRGAGGTVPALPEAGYRLRLEGRVEKFDDGRAIRCRAQGNDQRPVCVIAVKLDRVAFEDAAGAVLSDWRTG